MSSPPALAPDCSTAPPTTDEAILADWLRSLSTASTTTPPSPTPPQLSLLSRSLSPSAAPLPRSTAHLILARLPASPLLPHLRKALTSPSPADLYLLSALLQTHPGEAADLLSEEGVSADLADAADLVESEEAREALAEVLGAAAGSKKGRRAVEGWGREWAGRVVRGTEGEGKRARLLALLGLVKLERGGSEAEDAVPPDPEEVRKQEDLHFSTLEDLLLSAPIPPPLILPALVLPALEALSYLTTSPRLSTRLVSSPLLPSLLAIPTSTTTTSSSIARATAQLKSLSLSSDPEAPQRPDDTALQYALASVLAHAAAYPPILTEEQKQMARLREVARAKNAGAKSTEPAEDPEATPTAARSRNSVLIKAGAANSLVSLSRSPSLSVRRAVGAALLGLTTEPSTRGTLLAQGVPRALLHLASAGPTPPEQPDLPALQALAKLTITTPPAGLYPPPVLSSAQAHIRPLAALFLSPQATQLQMFEALLGLTNVASLGPQLAGRIVAFSPSPPPSTSTSSEGGIGTLVESTESHLLSSHEQLQRGATELLCNLLSFSSLLFSRYTSAPGAQNRLHLLLALSDAELLPTRLAASGALAQLVNDPQACARLVDRKEGDGVRKLVRVLVELLSEGDPPHLGLAHRGLAILAAALGNLEREGEVVEKLREAAGEEGLVQTVVGVLARWGTKEEGEVVLQLGRNVLLGLKESGVRIEL